MKKALVLVSLLAFLTVAFSSCKSHERCPAYGKTKANTEKTKPV